MPIEYQIDNARRLVMARGHGIFTHQDVHGYQQEVWSRPDVCGFNELVDMTGVTSIDLKSFDNIRNLANVAAKMDNKSSSSKFAIVAPGDEAFGLGRMFQTYRNMAEGGTKEVGVFRSSAEAYAFLGIKE